LLCAYCTLFWIGFQIHVKALAIFIFVDITGHTSLLVVSWKGLDLFQITVKIDISHLIFNLLLGEILVGTPVLHSEWFWCSKVHLIVIQIIWLEVTDHVTKLADVFCIVIVLEGVKVDCHQIWIALDPVFCKLNQVWFASLF
jgi:hypothetical protein